METGKLNWDKLTEIIENNKGSKRPEVIESGAVGEDCAAFKLSKNESIVITTDPVTAADQDIGKIAFHININDIATSGGSPFAIMVTILAPRGTSVEAIKEIMSDISNEAKKIDVEILGGHTEITDSVNKIIVSITALGLVEKSQDIIWTKDAKVGDKIIVTKDICLEGTSILCKDFKKESLEVLSLKELEYGASFGEELSVLKEGMLVKDIASSMHDITEGGILGALWELKEASGIGFLIDYEKIPIRDITTKLSKHFNVDPLKFISSGSMIITVNKENSEKTIEILKENNIKGTIIGEIKEKGAFMLKNNLKEAIKPPSRDEIYKLYI